MTKKKRKKKSLKPAGRLRPVLAANVSLLMQTQLETYGDKVKELARRAGVSRSSVQRIVNAQHGASVDVIERVADALKVSAFQLLIPKI